jgi:hypothetical protein
VLHLSRQRRGVWYARGTIYVDRLPSPIAEFSTHCTDKAEAEQVVMRCEEEAIAATRRRLAAEATQIATWRTAEVSRALPRWAAILWKDTQKRALKAGIFFDLDIRDMAEMIERASGHCEVSGVPFNLARPAGGFRRPLAPSIDRIAASIGYDARNCRLVCCAVNIAMNEWGEDVFMMIARATVAKRGP